MRGEINGRMLALSKKTGKQSVVAIALRQGKIVGVGRNNYRESSREQRLAARGINDKKIYNHAEINCLRKVNKADTLIVVRISQGGNLGNAQPCEVCRKYISDHFPKLKVITT